MYIRQEKYAIIACLRLSACLRLPEKGHHTGGDRRILYETRLAISFIVFHKCGDVWRLFFDGDKINHV